MGVKTAQKNPSPFMQQLGLLFDINSVAYRNGKNRKTTRVGKMKGRPPCQAYRLAEIPRGE
jgi:hypothetical protein